MKIYEDQDKQAKQAGGSTAIRAGGSVPEQDGLFSASDRELALCEKIDAKALQWARSLRARCERHAELRRREDLERISYFESFPHLAHRVTPVMAEEGETNEFFLTSAACYGAYFSRQGETISTDEILTVRATCRRREREYEPLRRQREFQMREVVAIGSTEHVERLLDQGREFILGLAAEYGIRGELVVATDPFFGKEDPRLLHQRMFPTKRELLDQGGLAIGSLNFHRTFFGDRCQMALPDGEPASTGCVAFGLERWVSAITRIQEDAA